MRRRVARQMRADINHEARSDKARQGSGGGRKTGGTTPRFLLAKPYSPVTSWSDYNHLENNAAAPSVRYNGSQSSGIVATRLKGAAAIRCRRISSRVAPGETLVLLKRQRDGGFHCVCGRSREQYRRAEQGHCGEKDDEQSAWRYRGILGLPCSGRQGFPTDRAGDGIHGSSACRARASCARKRSCKVSSPTITPPSALSRTKTMPMPDSMSRVCASLIGASRRQVSAS